MEWRVGQGYDIHRFEFGRPLVLGGVTIVHERGLAGHSDADALVHAIMDAILGAAGLGDIGTHFPPSDESWRGIKSLDLLSRTVALVRQARWQPINVDATIIAECPLISPYVPEMKQHISAVLHLPADAVGVKATTNERIGAIGREEGIAALAVALLQRT